MLDPVIMLSKSGKCTEQCGCWKRIWEGSVQVGRGWEENGMGKDQISGEGETGGIS